MLVPEVAYQFQVAKDLAGSTIDTVKETVAASAANILVTTGTILTVPNDRFLILSNVTAFATGSGGQNCTSIIAFAFDGVNRQHNFAAAGPGSVNSVQVLPLFTPIWIPPAWQVRVNANFNAGAAVNSLTASIWGALIPRANVSER